MPHRLASRPFEASVLLGLAFLLAWDMVGLDRSLAQGFGTANGFAWRDNFWLNRVLHDGAQRAGWVFLAGLVLACIWPIGVMRPLARPERWSMVLGTVLAVLAVSALKGASRTSCPWDLAEFGGNAVYVSHWAWGVLDGGGGHCFPAGHASTGFAMVAGYFGLKQKAPGAARLWLVCALLVGFGLGGVQQVRGAHFMSHTLWTAWICWTVAGWTHAAILSRWHGQPPAVAA